MLEKLWAPNICFSDFSTFLEEVRTMEPLINLNNITCSLGESGILQWKIREIV